MRCGAWAHNCKATAILCVFGGWIEPEVFLGGKHGPKGLNPMASHMLWALPVSSTFGGSKVQDQPWLHSKLQASLGLHRILSQNQTKPN